MVRQLQLVWNRSGRAPGWLDAVVGAPAGVRQKTRGAGREQGPMMRTIQLALSDTAKAEALRSVLARSGSAPVECVKRPNPESACAVVVDCAHLGLLPVPLTHPQRVVLLAPGDEESLREAWELGVGSVVNELDPLNTVVLAILAVCLRAGPAKEAAVADDASPQARRETRA
jgi:hypothetical protein